MKKISILGSTGSIGTQTLEVADFLGDVQIEALSAGGNTELLEKQIRKYKPKFAAVADGKKASQLKISVADTDTKILSGEEGLIAVAGDTDADAVVTAIVGIAGLKPTMSAIDAGKDILLANKETLVTAGDIVMKAARDKGINIIPVDSEHSAIFQCMGRGVKKLIITASGGAFYGKSADEIKNATAEDALKHPNWSMGKKITIDSATLMNKGLEVIEAHHLFNMDYDDIDVVIHRESIIHSMVQFMDGSVLAQMGYPDMRLPIHYAVCYPERVESVCDELDFEKISKLTFGKPDYDTFTCLKTAITAGKKGGNAPAAVNAANEIAVAKFLKGEITFGEIAEIVASALVNNKFIINPNLDDIIETDRIIRELSKC